MSLIAGQLTFPTARSRRPDRDYQSYLELTVKLLPLLKNKVAWNPHEGSRILYYARVS